MTEGFVQRESVNMIIYYMVHKEKVSQYKNMCWLVKENMIHNSCTNTWKLYQDNMREWNWLPFVCIVMASPDEERCLDGSTGYGEWQILQFFVRSTNCILEAGETFTNPLEPTSTVIKSTTKLLLYTFSASSLYFNSFFSLASLKFVSKQTVSSMMIAVLVSPLYTTRSGHRSGGTKLGGNWYWSVRSARMIMSSGIRCFMNSVMIWRTSSCLLLYRHSSSATSQLFSTWQKVLRSPQSLHAANRWSFFLHSDKLALWGRVSLAAFRANFIWDEGRVVWI